MLRGGAAFFAELRKVRTYSPAPAGISRAAGTASLSGTMVIGPLNPPVRSIRSFTGAVWPGYMLTAELVV